MTTLVLTVIGDDRAGLVSGLSDVIARHHGNWTTSQLAELAGKFAGIVVVDVPDERTDALRQDLAGLSGLLDVAVHAGQSAVQSPGTRLELEFVGADRPGIVRDITDVITRSGGSIDSLVSAVIEAPMAGGTLFTARAAVRVAEGSDSALRAALEEIADELMVDFTFPAAA